MDDENKENYSLDSESESSDEEDIRGVDKL